MPTVDPIRSKIVSILHQQVNLLKERSEGKNVLANGEIDRLKTLSEIYIMFLTKAPNAKRKLPPGARASTENLLKYASE